MRMPGAGSDPMSAHFRQTKRKIPRQILRRAPSPPGRAIDRAFPDHKRRSGSLDPQRPFRPSGAPTCCEEFLAQDQARIAPAGESHEGGKYCPPNDPYVHTKNSYEKRLPRCYAHDIVLSSSVARAASVVQDQRCRYGIGTHVACVHPRGRDTGSLYLRWGRPFCCSCSLHS